MMARPALQIRDYDRANAYLEKHYLAEHNRRYAHAALAPADYHRRRPTTRQLDEVFWLEEERVVSEDWGRALPQSTATTGTAKSALGTGAEPRAGEGK